ncbi:DNA-binding transcriptional regulator, XRE-family HTH domain [Myroides marinus]|uniref:DNA-binding transcriptional regulator, XRE-family HTH domain n=2 Tax=Myroides marinus TaxID=703342 RepID=A0A1H6YGA6_9FLAO|nr:DNA-binding transcriptional regulator, XRE-family HTH domain [Myroides marinus]
MVNLVLTNLSKMKTYPLDQIIEEQIGAIGTQKRDLFESKIQFELIGSKIKAIRKEKRLTQTQLGELVGVQKAQISKIENNTSNVKITTLLKVLNALGSKLTWEIKG